MALQINVKSSTGLQIENAYFKINDYSCDKTNTVSARLTAYVSRELEQEGHDPIEGTEKIISIQVSYLPDSENTKAQIYNHVKTLPEYENTIDVLEDAA